jgi:hypothetical protein
MLIACQQRRQAKFEQKTLSHKMLAFTLGDPLEE